MAPSKKRGGGKGGGSKKKAKTSQSSGTPLKFEKYADEDEGCVTMEGLAKLAVDLGIDAATDTKLLALCWRLGATKPGVIQKDEWAKFETCPELPTFSSSYVRLCLVLHSLRTVEALKSGWGQLDPSFLENAEFRPFYKFCFEFNREGTKKFLERDTAIALLPLCIENRSIHAASFVEFLETKPEDFKLNKDQWCSFLDFSVSVGVGPKFEGWDAEESSWPILLDEFVEWSKTTHQPAPTPTKKKKK
ncbi:hypothetical protein CTAYLR_000807 [Chrysophaeum taylorii]|uniref:Defective in cullin neddylation protein n=1 Tax=Chrysophaeum taylorii TaxID=2483200 RepID=A0AAD7UP96_9STRA|nr:hypothetical protein CTAYLR_000807 [Chrysophaeum taylorii]